MDHSLHVTLVHALPYTVVICLLALGARTFVLPVKGTTPSTVDGRSGYQWKESVVAYLMWRSGADWRPVFDRWHPDRINYLHAVALVNRAFNGPDPGPSAVLAEPEPKELRAARLALVRSPKKSGGVA